MKQTFVVDTDGLDVFEFERLLRTIITMVYPDWKQFVREWACELDSDEYMKCPECQQNVYNQDQYCKWCGKQLSQPIGVVRLND